MRYVIQGVATAGFLVLAGACVTGNESRLGSYDALPGTPTYVDVQNNNWADMDVFIVRRGEGKRLGMVTSMNRERFRIPQSWVDRAEQIAIQVELIGSDAVFQSQDVPLEAGSVLDLTVQNTLAMSHMRIR